MLPARSLARSSSAVVLVAVLAACSGDPAPSATRATAPPAAPVSAAAPTAPVSAAVPAPARLAAVPAAGTVTVQPGPFDDRFSLAATRLSGGAVSTSLTVQSDVSELIVLETQADFYDASGALLGTARAVHEDDHGDGEQHSVAEAVPLQMAADPAYAARVHSAVLSVPVLVNE